MSDSPKKVKVVTHNGSFHADDILAVATLNLLYRGNIEIIRTRDGSIIESGDIVLDVGGIYDPEQNRFDHHQEGGADIRTNGVPYAAFGLIWRHFGLKLVDNIQVHESIDSDFVQQIDAADTGYLDFYSEKLQNVIWTPNQIFRTFEPDDEISTPESLMENFVYLVEFATNFLEKLIIKKTNQVIDWQEVAKAYDRAKDKRIVVLDKGASWHEILIPTETIYVIFPSNSDNSYRIYAVPKEKGKYPTKKPFPESWRGKTNEELQKATGNSGAMFCHNVGFTMAVDNLENSIILAKKSLES